MADITATNFLRRTVNEHDSRYLERVYEWDLVGQGTTTAATHNLIAIPQGEAFFDAYAVVTELFAGGTSVLLLMTSSGTNANFTGAVITADLTVGSCIYLRQDLAITATGTLNDYFHDGTVITSLTLDATTVGTYTAGKMEICVRTIDIDSIVGTTNAVT